MAEVTLATPQPHPDQRDQVKRARSRDLVLAETAGEYFFAVVGHAGSGTSLVAEGLRDHLSSTKIEGRPIHVEILKARDVIEAWARKNNRPVPERQGRRLLKNVQLLQDYGDQMRSETTAAGDGDHAAIARALIREIRSRRAAACKTELKEGEPVPPDGNPRAFILDALRHPAEVELLRFLYRDAFVLVGVVCEEDKRRERITEKYDDAGHGAAQAFMARDANAKEKYGQHVADAFHLSDYFVDNTLDRVSKDNQPNPDWDVTERLSRLVKLIVHADLVRPTVSETAMYQAYSVQMRSACLSRQVGAALMDASGNIVATGTNEVPRAGGGVYGESFGPEEGTKDARCALFRSPSERYCRNTREQNKIIDELVEQVQELRELPEPRKAQLKGELRTTRIGLLLEFSRAVHAEMDALLTAARKGVSVKGTRLFVTTFPCHYCARHIVAAGVDEVQYVEPYPKSQALELHRDAIAVEYSATWVPPSQDAVRGKVLFRPFAGVAPRLYKRAFMKDRDLKDTISGAMRIQSPLWGTPWEISRVSYTSLEASLAKE